MIMSYLHMNIADFEDGSSFEIVVANPKRFLIIPGPKCSVPALMRFVGYVFEHFQEGSVREWSRQEATE